MKWGLAILIIFLLAIIPSSTSGLVVVRMNEDSSFQMNETVHKIFNLTENTTFQMEMIPDIIEVNEVEGSLNFTPVENWFGLFEISFTFNTSGNITYDMILVNVTNVNDDPTIQEILLNGDPSTLANPVAAILNYTDIDSDDVEIIWYLDEEEIGKGETVQRYIYPDQNNLTVVIDDGNGGMDSMTVTIHTIPPKGWGDGPDNTKNRIIFWIIFGSAGTILLAAMIWVLFRPESKDHFGSPPVKGK